MVISIALAFSLAACSSSLPRLPADTTRKAAVDTFLYAQLAANSYEPHTAFKLPPEIVLSANHYADDSTGFAYSVYKLTNPERVAIAFRGTDGLRDWLLGNFLGLQNERGLEAFKRVRETTSSGIPIVLIGHSLGGAIAQHVSLRVEAVSVYAFNSSTRFTRGPSPKSNPIWLISEYGEANRILDWITIDPFGKQTIVSCTLGGPVTNHSQQPLAACLTRIAAESGDRTAQWSLVHNQ